MSASTDARNSDASAFALYVIGAGTILPAASGYRACHLRDGSLRIDPNWRLLMRTSTTDDTWLAGCRHEPSFLWAVSPAALAASAAGSRPAAGGVAHPPKKLCVLSGQRTPTSGVGRPCTSTDVSTLSGVVPGLNSQGRSAPRRQCRRKRRWECRWGVCDNLLYKDQGSLARSICRPSASCALPNSDSRQPLAPPGRLRRPDVPIEHSGEVGLLLDDTRGRPSTRNGIVVLAEKLTLATVVPDPCQMQWQIVVTNGREL